MRHIHIYIYVHVGVLLKLPQRALGSYPSAALVARVFLVPALHFTGLRLRITSLASRQRPLRGLLCALQVGVAPHSSTTV